MHSFEPGALQQFWVQHDVPQHGDGPQHLGQQAPVVGSQSVALILAGIRGRERKKFRSYLADGHGGHPGKDAIGRPPQKTASVNMPTQVHRPGQCPYRVLVEPSLGSEPPLGSIDTTA